MPKSLDLQQVFNQILAGESVVLLFPEKKHYDSARASLLRKFKEYRKMIGGLGVADPYEGQYLQARFDSEEVKGTFKLADESEKTNNPGKQYLVEDLE